MHRDATCQGTVGCNECGGAPFILQHLAQRQRDGLRLLGGGCQFGRRDAAQPALIGVERGPFAGEFGRRESVGDRPTTRDRRIMPAALAPDLELAAIDPHPV